MGRPYKLFTASLATGNALASLRVTKKTRLRAITFAMYGLAGASVDARYSVEVSKQNVGSQTINDTPDTVLAMATMASNVSAGAAATNLTIVGLDLPCDVGDTLYLNGLAAGTAWGVGSVSVFIYTQD